MALEGAEGGILLWSLLVLCMKAKSPPPSPLMPETLFDHVPIMVHLSEQRMSQKVLRACTPVSINVTEHHFAIAESMTTSQRASIHAEAEASFSRIWAHVDEQFNEAIANGDVNEANRLWNLGAELWLYLGQKTSLPEGGLTPRVRQT